LVKQLADPLQYYFAEKLVFKLLIWSNYFRMVISEDSLTNVLPFVKKMRMYKMEMTSSRLERLWPMKQYLEAKSMLPLNELIGSSILFSMCDGVCKDIGRLAFMMSEGSFLISLFSIYEWDSPKSMILENCSGLCCCVRRKA